MPGARSFEVREPLRLPPVRTSEAKGALAIADPGAVYLKFPRGLVAMLLEPQIDPCWSLTAHRANDKFARFGFESGGRKCLREPCACGSDCSMNGPHDKRWRNHIPA
jgi:hypothetical protein